MGIVLLLILGVNAGLGTVQSLTGGSETPSGLPGILGATSAGTKNAA